MALKRLAKTPTPSSKQINYLAKTFDDFRQNLFTYIQTYFPDNYNDFSEASVGTIFIELASYIGDVLSYYTDASMKENLLLYATEQSNVIAIAQALGYNVKPAKAAYCDVDLFQIVPAQGIAANYEPDPRFFIRLAPNAVFASEQFGPVQFRTTDEVNFADPTDREITVYSVDGQLRPLFYLVHKIVQVVAGTIQTTTATFNAPSKFSVVTIPDTNVLEIISVVDGDGNTWYQTDYLAQDLVFQDTINLNTTVSSSFSVPPTYTTQIIRTPRRFVVRYNENFECELHFGSGVLDDTDATINLEPKKIANSEYQTNLGSTSLDPSDFLSSRSYGLAPTGVLTITYTTGGGLETNVPSNSITKVVTVDPLNDTTSLSPSDLAVWNTVKSSLAVNNLNPAGGGKGADSVEEIRQNALAFFNSQNRLVTAQDYIVRTYAMPQKYGGVAKAFVTNEENINNVLRATQTQQPQDGLFVTDVPGRGIINLYVLGYNQQKQLVPLNDDVKMNLRLYLDQYRMLSDTVNIFDAFPITIGVNFRIVCFRNVNVNECLARCIDAIADYFDVDKWQIGQCIVLNDLYLVIASVDGVQTIQDLEIVNKYSFTDGDGYSDYLYDIDAATVDGVIYCSLDPSIFCIKDKNFDITGSASS